MRENEARGDAFCSTPLTEFDDMTLFDVVVCWPHPEPPFPEFAEDCEFEDVDELNSCVGRHRSGGAGRVCG